MDSEKAIWADKCGRSEAAAADWPSDEQYHHGNDDQQTEDDSDGRPGDDGIGAVVTAITRYRHKQLTPTVFFIQQQQQQQQHPFNGPFPGLPGWAGTRKWKNQCGFYWSKRQWVAVASAGPYACLHLAADR